MQVKIGDKIQNFIIGGYEYDECVIEFDEKLYAYVGVHRATGKKVLGTPWFFATMGKIVIL
jgi:hypothetical protein